MVLRSDNGLGAIRMMREKHRVEGVQSLFIVVGHRHILLFVHRLQFRMETAENTVHEAVGLDAGPVIQLVGGNLLHVAGYILAGEGVGALRSDDGHQLVILVGNGQFGRLVTDRIDFPVQGQTLGRVR